MIITWRQHYPTFIFYGGLLIVLGITVTGWWLGNYPGLSSDGAQLTAIGRLLGLLAAISILIEVLLVSRWPFIEKNFDLDTNMDLHRLNGFSTAALTIGHILFLTVGYSQTFQIGLLSQFWQFNTGFKDVLIATIGTVLIFIITFISVRLIRKRLRYELWHALHLVIYATIIMTFLHQLSSGGDFITQTWFKLFWQLLFATVLGLLLVYRFLRPLIYFWRYRFNIERIVTEAQDIYSIYITGNNIQNFKFLAGQYATCWFLAKNTWWEGHPYSFSAEPNKRYLRITVKASGDFGKKIIRLKAGTPILIDGPRGAFTARRANLANVVLIAGGIGIAPYLATIKGLLKDGKQVSLFYAVHDKNQIAFSQELATLEKKGLKLKIFNSLAGNRIDRQTLQTCTAKDINVFICGPIKMTRDFCQTLRACGLCDKQIVAERFAM